MAPTDGSSYIGLVNVYCDTWNEGASQQLSAPMTAGTEYTFTLDLASPGAASGGITDGCIELEIWGGMGNCAHGELLWTSPVLVNNTPWNTYTVTFTPTANWTHIFLQSHEPDQPCAGCSDQPYIMVDNMTPIQADPSVRITSPASGATLGCGFTVTGENDCVLDSLILTGNFTGSPQNANLLTDSTWDAFVSYPPSFSGTDTIYGEAFFQNGDTAYVQVGIVVDGIDATANLTDPTCNGVCDGSITINANGGNTPYQYSIDGGSSYQNGNSFNGLCDGTYNLLVEGSSGCAWDTTVTLTEPPALNIDDTLVTDVTCNGDCDGSIEFQVSGGTPPYQYSIDNGASFQGGDVFNGLCAGNYDLVVEDANGCQEGGQVRVREPDPLTLDTTIVDLACYNDGSGEIHFENIQGGTTPYQFSIDGGATFQNDSDFVGLSAANYDLVLEDANGCQVTGQVDITEPPLLEISGFTTDSARCNGSCDGMADVTVTGGSGAYTYNWSGGIAPSSSSLANNVCAGNYTLTVEDDSSCTVDTSFSIGEPPAMNITVDSLRHASCFGNCDGGAFISVSGGVPPYSYQWNDPAAQNTQDATGLCTGSYEVVVTDDNACKDSVQVSIDEPAPLQVTSSSDTTICIGGTAILSANASGGTPPYSYHWDQGLGTGQTHPVSPGSNTIYQVHVEDANGCISPDASIRVQYHPPLTVDAFSDDSICPGKSSTVSAIGSGGSGQGYSYSWSNGDTGPSTTVAPSSNTTYTVTLEDDCETPSATDDVDITLHELPDVRIDGNDLEDCSPVNATLINATADSMVGTQCIWDFGDGEQGTGCNSVQHRYTQPGCYDVSLSVRSPKGCVDSTTATDYVCVRPYPTADFDFRPKETTVQDPAISFTNLSTGASTYRWSFDSLDSSDEVNPSYAFPADGAGSYDVCLMSENLYGCRDSICKEVTVGGEFILYVPNAFTPDGDGVNDKFYPVVQGADPTNYHFYIYDRWGELVFEAHHPERKWDGSIKGSKSASKTDVYAWRLVTTNKYTGEEIIKTGHVTLIR